MTNNLLYTKELMHYFKNQPYKKDLQNYDYFGKASNDHCGDNIEVKIKVNEEGEIVDIGYKSDGCAVSQSYMSMLAEDIVGLNISGLLKLNDNYVESLIDLDLTPSRKNCALVGLKAVKDAVRKDK